MTTTKRKALHGRTKDCLNYIMNLDKTRDGTLVTGINCSPEFAYEEMCMVNRLYGNSGNRVGYHIFQNFNYLDDISPEKAHELGVQLAKELYPDYQCVVATHTDKAHIHNHICINSINLKTGNKLVDKLNHPEGIAYLREVSDRISRENGLTVIEEAPPIGQYKKKNFLYHYANKNWRGQIVTDIESLINEAESFDHLLDLLSIRGYRIKKGKYVKIAPVGSDLYFKLARINNGEYSESKLRQRIYENTKIDISYHQNNIYQHYKYIDETNNLADKHFDLKTNLMIKRGKLSSIINKQDSIVFKQNLQYNKYQKRRYEIKKQLNQMKNILTILNDTHIKDYDDLMLKISDAEAIYKDLKDNLDEIKQKNYLYQDIQSILKIYVELFSLSELIEEENIINNKAMKHTYQKEIKMFEEAKKELNMKFHVNSLEDAKELMVQTNKNKRLFVEELSKIRVHIKHMNALYELKNQIFECDIKKENDNLFKGFSINTNMIDYKRSNDNILCVRIPYTNNYIYISKNQCSWIKFNERLQIYFIEDQEFKIYDKNNHEIEFKSAEHLCQDNETYINKYRNKDLPKNK